jgi:hypothetical protein
LVEWFTFTSTINHQQFTITHNTSSESAFTSRCLVTGLNNGYSSAKFSLSVSWQQILTQSHCNFKSHVKSSSHRLIHFLPFLPLPIPRLRCTPFMSILFMLLFLQTGCLIYTWHGPTENTCQCQNAWRGPHKKHRLLYCCEDMFTAPFPSSKVLLLRARVFSKHLPSNGYTHYNIDIRICLFR